jgi:2,3-bisphosphoglycerate-dependent phosphoglycerate mutase
MTKNFKAILLRHGQSVWNEQDLFTGWEDVELSNLGVKEATEAGHVIKKSGIALTHCYTSVLKRAIKTCWLALDAMDAVAMPQVHHWRLNERHYGALQGKNKKETAALYGEEQVKIWRRSFTTPPPGLSEMSRAKAFFGLDFEPLSESLAQTIERVKPYWSSTLEPAIFQQQQIPLIVAHGNSLRGLIKDIEGISDEDIVHLEIPTGKPILIEWDQEKIFKSRTYLN